MNFEKEITSDSIISLIESDDIERNKYLLSFLNIINRTGKNRIISLNGDWGSGKTIFIKKMELLIKYCFMYKNGKPLNKDAYIYNDNFIIDNIEKIESIISKEPYKTFDRIVKDNLIDCVYFNAWEHDDEEDPIISLLYEVIKKYNLSNETKKINLNSLSGLINTIVKNISLGRLDFSGTITKDNLAELINRKETIQEAVQNTIDNLINERCSKCVIFIDELDRCNPKYSVKLLERIKHYFVDPRIVIIISTNILELSNTVSVLYGNKFDSVKYLDKFFDIRLSLPDVPIDKYIKSLDTTIDYNGSHRFAKAAKAFMRYKGLNQREINRYLGYLRFFEKHIHNGSVYFDNDIRNLIEYLIIPYMVGVFVTQIDEYNLFISNKGWDEFENYLKSDTMLINSFFYTFYNSETKLKSDITENILLEEFEKLYNCIFDENSKSKYKTIGEVNIERIGFNYLSDEMSLLGALSDFGGEK